MGKGNRLRKERNHNSEKIDRKEYQSLCELYDQLGKFEQDCKVGASVSLVACLGPKSETPDCFLVSYKLYEAQEVLGQLLADAANKYKGQCRMLVASSGNPEEWAEFRGLFKQNCQFVLDSICVHALQRPQDHIGTCELRDMLAELNARTMVANLLAA